MSEHNVSNALVPCSPSHVASQDSSSPALGNASLVDLTVDSGMSPLDPGTVPSTSISIQTSLILADTDVLSVAVLHAVSTLRPETTDSACNTAYSRDEDHLSPELLVSLTKADTHLSLIMDCLTTPRPESQKAKMRTKLPEHWRSNLSSLHVADDLLFLDEHLVMPACLQTPIISLLHSTHAGARAMLSMAEFIWFPHMVRSLQSMARTCPSCTATGKNLTVVSAKAATAAPGASFRPRG